MPKLTDYKEVAVIEIAGKDYHFAIYPFFRRKPRPT